MHISNISSQVVPQSVCAKEQIHKYCIFTLDHQQQNLNLQRSTVCSECILLTLDSMFVVYKLLAKEPESQS